MPPTDSLATPAASIAVPQGCTLQDGLVVCPPRPKKDWCLDDFEILHKLGGGQYGLVSLACVKGTNMVVALKKMQLAELVKQKMIGQLRREIEIAFHTRHKYLLRTYTYFYDSDSIYLVLEACAKGMLYSELMRVHRYPPSTAARYVAQLGEALLYMHEHHILHRDIKPENILLDHASNIKLADFGWSVHDPNDRRRTACGTPEYFPPEIVEGNAYDTSADLWCLGVFCFELLAGKTPFFDKDQKQIYKNIKALQFEFPESIPDDARDLIGSLLRRQGAERLTLNRVLRHRFLVKNYYEPNDVAPPLGKRERPI